MARYNKKPTVFLTAIILLVILGPIAFFALRKPKTTAAWFNDQWHYRQVLLINNSGSLISTDRKIKFDVDTQTLITNGKMKSDCSDVRFTDRSGKLLDYFIDTATANCNTNSTDFYIRVSQVIAGSQEFYLYYGNQSAENVIKNDFFLSDSSGKGLKGYWKMDDNVIGNAQSILDYAQTNNGTTVDTNATGMDCSVTGKIGLGCSFDGSNDYISLANLGVDTSAGGKNTVSFWMYWNGAQGKMPFGWTQYDLWTQSNCFGFNGAQSNIIGTSTSNTPANQWVHVAATFFNGVPNINDNELYINGVKQTLTACVGTTNASKTVTTNATIANWNNLGNYYFGGKLDDFRLYNRALTQSEVNSIFNNNNGSELSIPPTFTPSSNTAGSEEVGEAPILWLKFDEGTGTTTNDSSGSNNIGTLVNGPTWQNEDQCISGKCLYFNGTSNYVINTSPNLKLSQGYTISAWLKPTKTIGDNRQWIVSSNDILMSYLLDSDGSLYFRTTGANTRDTTYNMVINKWQHVVLTFDGSNKKTYIDGTLIDNYSYIGSINPITWISIGGDYQDGTPNDWYNGYIDDVKIYPYVRTADQIKIDYQTGISGQSTSQGNTSSFGSTSTGKSLTDGLVAYWKMDEATWSGILSEVKDSTGNNYNGQSKNSTTTGYGKYGNGGIFDGTSNYIDIAGVPNFLNTKSEMTVSAWVKLDQSLDSKYRWIIRKSAAGYPYFFGVNTGNKLVLTINDNGYNLGVNLNIDLTWHHLVGVFKDSTIYYYVDGVFIGSHTTTQNRINDSTGTVSLGGWTTFNQRWRGSIDETRIYNRALSPQEIKTLYEYAPGPIGYWKFDEISGTTVTDTSGNGNDGVWSGTLGNQWTKGILGNAGNFNGSNNKVTIPNNDFFDIYSFTINYWAKFGEKRAVMPITKGIHAYSTPGYRFYINPSGSMEFPVMDGTNTISIGTNINNYLSKWSYYTGVWDKNLKKTKLYIDGKLIGEGTGTNFGSSSNDYFLLFGAGSSGYNYQGLIDEVKIYDYVRTPAQILQDMQGTSNSLTSSNKISQPMIWYKLNESKGNVLNNNGLLKTAGNGSFLTDTTAPNWTKGKEDRALNFDGVNDYASSVNGTALGLTNQLSISAWFKGTGTILSSGNTYCGTAGDFYITHTGFYVKNSSCSATSLTFSPTTTEWNHVVATVNDTSMKLYLNGKLSSSLNNLSGYTSLKGADNIIRIGSNTGGNTYFTGQIDEVKMYNYELTEDEVKQDYNSQSTTRVGATTQTINDTTTSLEYCPPGDTSTCYSPVVEYDFEEGQGDNVNDKSGNNANTTNVNNPSWATGKIGKGMQFDGSSNFTKNTSTPLTSLTNWSLEAWIKPANLSQIGLAVYNGKDSGGYGFGVGNGSGGAGNKLQGLLGGIVWLNSNYTFPIANEWYHIVMTRDTSTTRMYVNGVQTSGYVSNTPATVQSAITVGALLDGSNNPFRYFSGSVDQVRFYNYTRTPAQIAWSYNKGKPLAYYKLDECQGNTIHDSSGNNIHGTLTVGASGTQTSIGTCNTTSTAWGNGATGKINSSLNFDGIDDYVQTSTPVSTSTTNITMSAWVKWSGTNTGSPQIIYFNGSTSSNGYGFYLNTSDKLVILTGGRGSYITSYTPPIDTWTHLLISRGTGNFSLYIDGINYPITLTGSSSVRTPTASTFFGGISGQSFSGQVDDVRFYNYAPTDTQIKELYNGSALNFAPAQ